ncbi:hypothetical protein [Macrococcus equipercicus]|uniref:RCHY1 zinc-ribbon domain-containing protein n=1 Tax=Macrococcus equipercicus TaxID=69967 RepID=A0A9Q9BUK1_9STAP|nr:hypothetical protein [Macrococcus equipercicus]UTH13322.1 hypothetical protein KFV11_08620 [Macrococcus equipercicus]
MPKKYNLGNKRDMDKFFKELEKDVKKQAEKNIRNSTLEIPCPNCGEKVKVSFRQGKGKCPKCGVSITQDQKWV